VSAALPTGRQGRLLALAVLLLVLATLYLMVAAPLIALYSDRAAEVDAKAALLIQLNAVAAELPALRSRAARLRAPVDNHKIMLAGTSDAVASAALQGRIETMATAAGMTIGSTEMLPAEARGEYRRIGLRLLVNGSYDSLIKLLASIETAVPPLLVNDLQIHSPELRLGVATNGELDASVAVYGFRSAKTAAPATP
jgi:general secretion pathway protein M